MHAGEGYTLMTGQKHYGLSAGLASESLVRWNWLDEMTLLGRLDRWAWMGLNWMDCLCWRGYKRSA